MRARDGVYWRVCESGRVGASECGSEREYGSDRVCGSYIVW